MLRPISAYTVAALACAALTCVPAVRAQQTTQADQYQGQSNPPADERIVTEQPEQPKPPASHPVEPLQPAPVLTPRPTVGDAPVGKAVLSHSTSVDPSVNFPGAADGTDDGIVQVAPDLADSAPGRQPRLETRTAGGDPDGDIVHPAGLPAGILGEGATIRARLLTRLSTSQSERGEEFRARVANDVVQDGQVLIPAGAEIDGHVVEVSEGHVGGRGSIHLRPESVLLLDGTRYSMNAQVIGTPGTNARVNREGTIEAGSRLKKDGLEYGGAVGVGAVTGAVMGGPVGALAGSLVGAGVITVHLLSDHPQANLEPGTVLLFSLNQRLNLVSTTGKATSAID